MGYVRIGLLLAVIALLLARYLMSGIEKKAVVKNGVTVLKINNIYGFIGAFIFLISIAIIIISSLVNEGFSEDIKTIAVLVIFLILGGTLFLFSVNIRVLVDEEKIVHYNILRRKKEIMWKDVRRVILNQRNLELILDAEESQIKIHNHMVGFLSFIKLMKTKLDYDIYKDAVSIIDSYKRSNRK